MDDLADKPMQRRVLTALAFVVAAFLVYALALNNPFLIDDHSAIVQHPDVQDLGGVLRLWGHHYWQGSPSLDDQLYRPVTIFSSWLSQRLTPDSPAGFRAVNLLLLAGIALCIVSWLRRYTGITPALIAGAIFLVHPANTEAINHLVGRADLLAVFGIVGFLAVQASAQEHGWNWPRIVGAAALALIALGSKESGVALVPCALAHWWVGQANSDDIASNEPRPSGSGPTAPEKTNACHTEHGVCPKRALFLALFLPAALYLAARLTIVGLPADYAPAPDDLTGNPLRGVGFVERLPDVFAVFWWYVHQMGMPDTAYNHTPAPGMIGQWRLASLGGIIVIGALLAAVLGGLRNRSKGVLPGVLFLSHWLIVGHLITVTGAYAANRLTVATSAVAAMLAVAVLHTLFHGFPERKKLTTAGALVIVLGLAFQTARANRAWSSELARMHADVQADDEDPIALYWLGQAQLPYDTDAAISHLKRAHALAPQSDQAATALADALLATGDDRAAWKHYATLLTRNTPLTDQQRANAAMAAFNTGRYDRARALTRGLPDGLAAPIERVLRAIGDGPAGQE